MSRSFPSHLGPTYEEMRTPAVLDPALRRQAAALQAEDPFHPHNLYNIRWHDVQGRINPLVVPSALSGVEANIVVLDGGRFPSGSMKVGPAYAILMEREIHAGLRPEAVRVIGPSTGNFGIGTAYVSRLKGYEARIVMPEGMSAERYALIRAYGGLTDLTPGTESDVVLTLRHTQRTYGGRPDCWVLGQFEDMANYRFHRHVTAEAVRRAVRELGLDRVDAFVSAPGSAGTLAAGDGLRGSFPDLKVAAVEPRECSTLFDGGGGQHVIEGIGDQMVTLIHNVFATDLVVRVAGEMTLRGMELMCAAPRVMEEVCGVTATEFAPLRHRFGPSGICNLLGAIQVARHLGLTREHTVVTIATDSHDRYGSVRENLAARLGRTPQPEDLAQWHREIMALDGEADVLALDAPGQHERLHRMKKTTWSEFGKDPAYMERMRDPEFWDEEYARIPELDRRWQEIRTAVDQNGT